jgi:CheY-like chemotaxis protein
VTAGSGQPVVALVPDLLFSSRIGETARRLGYPFRVARTAEELERILAEAPRLVLVDLTARGLDLEAALAAIAATDRSTPVVGWTTHVLWKATKPLHRLCTRVVTRETLTAELPELLEGCGAPGDRERQALEGTLSNEPRGRTTHGQ